MFKQELRSQASVIEYIRKHGIFNYLNNYHLPDETGFVYHYAGARAGLKKHYPIYKKQIELWERLHGLKEAKSPLEKG